MSHCKTLVLLTIVPKIALEILMMLLWGSAKKVSELIVGTLMQFVVYDEVRLNMNG